MRVRTEIRVGMVDTGIICWKGSKYNNNYKSSTPPTNTVDFRFNVLKLTTFQLLSHYQNKGQEKDETIRSCMSQP